MTRHANDMQASPTHLWCCGNAYSYSYLILAVKMNITWWFFFLLCTSAWLLSLLSVGLFVHQYHLSVQNKAQKEGILQLRVTIKQLSATIEQLRAKVVKLQEENGHLRNGSSSWDRLWLGVISVVVEGVATGVTNGVAVPITSLCQTITNFLHPAFAN